MTGLMGRFRYLLPDDLPIFVDEEATKLGHQIVAIPRQSTFSLILTEKPSAIACAEVRNWLLLTRITMDSPPCYMKLAARPDE